MKRYILIIMLFLFCLLSNDMQAIEEKTILEESISCIENLEILTPFI